MKTLMFKILEIILYLLDNQNKISNLLLYRVLSVVHSQYGNFYGKSLG